MSWTLWPPINSFFRKLSPLRHHEQQPRGVPSVSPTLYLPIKLNDTILPKVGVFIPEHFQQTAALNLIVYFHGNIESFCKTEPAPFKTKGIEYYLDTPLFRCLREELSASKANAILIAPTLSVKFGSVTPSWSPRYGNLNEDGKFDYLINETLTRLKGSEVLPPDAQASRIILSAHSAGGVAMMKILAASNVLKANIAECWGFECLYFGTDIWKAWLSANANKQFRHFRQPTEQGEPTSELKNHDNFVDIPNGSSHCSLLKENWREAIDKSGTLHPTDAIA
jgi:hypothetical protein